MPGLPAMRIVWDAAMASLGGLRWTGHFGTFARCLCGAMDFVRISSVTVSCSSIARITHKTVHSTCLFPKSAKVPYLWSFNLVFQALVAWQSWGVLAVSRYCLTLLLEVCDNAKHIHLSQGLQYMAKRCYKIKAVRHNPNTNKHERITRTAWSVGSAFREASELNAANWEVTAIDRVESLIGDWNEARSAISLAAKASQ